MNDSLLYNLMSNFGHDYEYQNTRRKSRMDFLKAKPPSQERDRKITSTKIDSELPNNAIQTSKYNLITFLPKNLFEQYSEV